MSILQKIRDKGAIISVVLIGLALLGFILMDAFSGRTGLGGSNSTTIGTINGRKVEFAAFETKVKQQEDAARQQGYDMGEAGRQQLLESVWNNEINQTLMDEQFAELGMVVSDKEINDYLLGANPPQDIRQRFTDQTTGQYDPNGVRQLIAGIKAQGKPEDKAQLSSYIAGLRSSRQMEKYYSLLNNTIYIPKWFIEKQNEDNSLLARTSFVTVPYTSISDSAVKVTDDEIKDYMNKHKKDFEQKEETRSINYVVFNAGPTAKDSAAVLAQVSNLKTAFQATADVPNFLVQQGSMIEFLDQYLPGSKIQIAVKDSIFTQPVGGVYGPYLDGGAYVLAKKLDAKTLPDSAKVRHILIQTYNPQTQQMTLTDSTAARRADSILTALRGGASFDSLVVRFSDDEGSKAKGGVYDFFPQGQMVKEFNDFVFNKPVGSRDTVKTQFGYHVIEILGQKGAQVNYKIAYMAKPIVPSDETDNAAANAASRFAGESRNAEAFNEEFNKNLRSKGINKLVAEDIKPGDFNITGLGLSRALVKNIFEADKGDVLQPERIGDAYVVAAVTDVHPAGMQSVNKARTLAEPVLRNKKKAEQIRAKLGKISTLEAASAAVGQPVQVADSLRFNGNNPTLSFESKVIGASFNPANKGKVVPEAIEGQSGVFVLRVESISATAVMAGSIEQQRQALQMQARQAAANVNPVDALKKTADIKDNRNKFY